MTLDGTPVVGATAVPNLFLDAGHGALGRTLACGSRQMTADVVGGGASVIEDSDLAISRYAKPIGTRT